MLSSSSVGKVIHNLLSVLLQPVPSLGGSLGPSEVLYLRPSYEAPGWHVMCK